jgi:hypothetical protein
MQDDRSSNAGGDPSGGDASEDHTGERKTHLSARSLAQRGEALDAGEDSEEPGGKAQDKTHGTR